MPTKRLKEFHQRLALMVAFQRTSHMSSTEFSLVLWMSSHTTVTPRDVKEISLKVSLLPRDSILELMTLSTIKGLLVGKALMIFKI